MNRAPYRRALRRLPAALALLAVLAARILTGTAHAEALTVSEVVRGVFVHAGKALALDAPGHDDIANIGFIVGTRCAAVVDSGGSVRVGRALRAALREHTSLPVCYVINTHVHVDHVLGNAAFRDERPRFVGHANLAAALARSREFFLSNYSADLEPGAGSESVIAPDQSVPVGGDLELDLGSRVLTLHAWPRAHSDCDLTVFDRSTATLWTGDLLFVSRTPVLDGSIRGWLAVSEELARMPAKHVIPGHGPPGADLATALGVQRDYLDAVLAGVRGEIAHGKPLQEALRDLMPRQSGWQLWDETHPRNVARAYQELEWE